MGKQHYAKYGKIVIPRMYCSECKRYSLILDGFLQCCNRNAKFETTKFRIMSESKDKRRKPSKKERIEILEKQNNKCLYCNNKFGDLIMRENEVLMVKLAWDHFAPYSFTHDNAVKNFVAACSICNSIKTNKIFLNIEEAKSYVEYRRKKKGYKEYTEEMSVL